MWILWKPAILQRSTGIYTPSPVDNHLSILRQIVSLSLRRELVHRHSSSVNRIAVCLSTDRQASSEPRALRSTDPCHKLLDGTGEKGILGHTGPHFLACVYDCGMVATAELVSDLWERRIRHFP